MDNSDSVPVTLASLDLFSLLRLDHFTEEQRQKYVEDLAGLAMEQLAVEVIPNFLSSTEIDDFVKMVSDSSNEQKAVAHLREKIPDFDLIFTNKLLEIKRNLVRANVEERLNLAVQEKERIREGAGGAGENDRLLQLEIERTNLEKTLQAINSDDWATVERLIREAVTVDRQ